MRHHIRPEDIRRAEDLGSFPVLTKDIVRTYSKQLLAKNISEMTVTGAKPAGPRASRCGSVKTESAKFGRVCATSGDLRGAEKQSKSRLYV